MTIGILSAAFLGVVGQASGPPTVYTLTLDDLLTRHYPGTDQRLKLTATAGTTGFIEIDDNATIYSASAIAADMQSKLEALTGYSGKVTVDGASTEAGDKYTFTVTFDGSLGAVTLAFHASSQWYPTITLAEVVDQQGVAEVTGVAEVVTITASGISDTTSDSNGNNVQTDGDGVYANHFAAGGWSPGSPSGTSVTFTKDAVGDVSTTQSGGSGTVVVNVEGVTPVTGQPEIHTITRQPVAPTGGYWKPAGLGADIEHHAIEAQIENQVFGGAAISVTASGTLDAGNVTITFPNNENLSDTFLSPVNTSLTAPEITHSIA